MILGLPQHKSTLQPEGEAPPNLPGWIDIATRDLVPPAQARIRIEIGAHYAEAVHSHQASGSTEAEAQSAALAELGSAHVAAIRFGREHLTNGDAKGVFWQARAQLPMGAVWAIAITTNSFYSKSIGAAGGLLICLLVVLIHFTIRFLVRRSRKVVTWRMVLLLLSFQWLNLVGFLWMIHIDKTDDQVIHVLMRLMAVCFLLLALVYSLILLQLRKKLAPGLNYDLSSDNRPTA